MAKDAVFPAALESIGHLSEKVERGLHSVKVSVMSTKLREGHSLKGGGCRRYSWMEKR